MRDTASTLTIEVKVAKEALRHHPMGVNRIRSRDRDRLRDRTRLRLRLRLRLWVRLPHSPSPLT